MLLTSSGHQSSSSGCCGVVLITCVLSIPRTSELELFNENMRKNRDANMLQDHFLQVYERIPFFSELNALTSLSQRYF